MGATRSANVYTGRMTAHEYDFEASEAEIVNPTASITSTRTPFRDGSGKYFIVVSTDEAGGRGVVDAESPTPTRNKIKTRLTFMKPSEKRCGALTARFA